MLLEIRNWNCPTTRQMGHIAQAKTITEKNHDMMTTQIKLFAKK